MVNPSEHAPETGPTYEQLHTLVFGLLERHGKPDKIQRYSAYIPLRHRLGGILVAKLTGGQSPKEYISGFRDSTVVELPFVWHSDTTYGESARLYFTEKLENHFNAELKYRHGRYVANPHPLSDHSAIDTRVFEIDLPLSLEGYDPTRFKTFYSFLQTMGEYLDAHPNESHPWDNFPSDKAVWIEEQEKQIMAEYHG